MSERDHLLQLAEAHGTRVFFDVEDRDAHADVRLREIHLGRSWIESGNPNPTYWSGLHELGHVVTQPPPISPLDTILGNPRITHWEAAAWDWALRNAISPLDEYARATISYSLGSYLARMGAPPDTSLVDLVVRTVGRPDWSLAPSFLDSWKGNEHELRAAWNARLVTEAVAA